MYTRTSGSQLRESAAGHWHATRHALGFFLRARSGVTAIEYGIITALVAVVIIGAINTLGQTALTQLFQKVANSL